MNTPLRIVHLEDDAVDRELVRRELRRAELAHDLRDADTADGFTRVLREFCPDVILADWALRGFGGMDALRIARDLAPDAPFLLVSGSIGEAAAVEALKSGATDFVPKDRLSQLAPAIQRALREACDRAAARRAEARFRAVFEASPDAVFIADGQGIIRSANPAARRMFGYDAPELLGRPLTLLMPPEYRERHAQAIARASRSGSVPLAGKTIGLQGLRKNGSVFPVELSLAVWREDGRPFYSGVIRDISERTQSAESRRRLTDILEATPDLVGIADRSGHVQYLNGAGRRLLGIGPAEDQTHRHIREFHPAAAFNALERAAFPAATRNGSWFGEVPFLHRDGTEIPFEMSLHVHRSPDGEVLFFSTISHDLRERRRLEEQLRQAQKMDAIGRLAGGVAHDFNNILTVINGYSQMLLSRHGRAGDPDHEALCEIARAGNRAADLTRQLLAFSRKQILQPRVFDLNRLVRDLEKMLQRMIPESIRIQTRLAPSSAAISADPGQIEQVLINLAVNARDAMPGGGTLIIETAADRKDPRWDRLHPGAGAAPHVLLAVHDTGTGMSREVRDHLFEPFFTTKEIGRGTGIGLSTVHGIIHQSGGWIDVDSAPGQGTVFRIYLPQAAPAADTGPDAVPADARGGSETILVAEDEPALRALVREVLSSEGYAVIEASNGEDALQVAVHRGGTIHLLLTDIVMPKMGGRELAKRLTADRPGLKTIFMCGYTDDTVVREGLRDSGLGFLQKPFAPDELVRRVHAVLDAGG